MSKVDICRVATH